MKIKYFKSVKIYQVVDALEHYAPLPLQEGYDNAGLQVGLTEAVEVSGALLCLDVTEAVVDEAIRKGCNLIVSHHPLIFRKLARISDENYVQRTVRKAIKNDITIVSMHTNMDAAKGGVNFKIAEKLGLRNLRFFGGDKGLDSVNEDSSNQQAYAHSNRSYEGQRNSFMFSLLVLASYIIKADGRVMHSEMELVRRFLSQNFGEQAKQQGEEILLKLFEQQKRLGMAEYRTVIQDSCHQIRANMAYEQRLQLLNFLVMIAQADAVVSPEEIAALKEVAIHMGLSVEDVIQMLNLRSGSSATSSLDDAYKVLGIAPSATNDEVKAAYRKMALKHHPDKVAALGEDVRKAAEKKFQEINDAKEKIFKARGL